MFELKLFDYIHQVLFFGFRMILLIQSIRIFYLFVDLINFLFQFKKILLKIKNHQNSLTFLCFRIFIDQASQNGQYFFFLLRFKYLRKLCYTLLYLLDVLPLYLTFDLILSLSSFNLRLSIRFWGINFLLSCSFDSILRFMRWRGRRRKHLHLWFKVRIHHVGILIYGRIMGEHGIVWVHMGNLHSWSLHSWKSHRRVHERLGVALRRRVKRIEHWRSHFVIACRWLIDTFSLYI